MTPEEPGWFGQNKKQVFCVKTIFLEKRFATWLGFPEGKNSGNLGLFCYFEGIQKTAFFEIKTPNVPFFFSLELC